MYTTEDFARRLASARLIERARLDIQESTGLGVSADDFLRLAATGPGGMALLTGEEVASLLVMIRGAAIHARDAHQDLDAAADLLRE